MAKINGVSTATNVTDLQQLFAAMESARNDVRRFAEQKVRLSGDTEMEEDFRDSMILATDAKIEKEEKLLNAATDKVVAAIAEHFTSKLNSNNPETRKNTRAEVIELIYPSK